MLKWEIIWYYILSAPNNTHSDTQAHGRLAGSRFFLSLNYADREVNQIIMVSSMAASIKVICHVVAPPHHVREAPYTWDETEG